MTKKHDAPRRRRAAAVSIIGLAGRFPKSESVQQLMANLTAGFDGVAEIPDDRWSWPSFYSENRRQPGKSISR